MGAVDARETRPLTAAASPPAAPGERSARRVLGDHRDREELVEEQSGLAIERVAVALLEGVDEAFVGSAENETGFVLAAHGERSEPGGELLGFEDGTQALLQARPVARVGMHGLGWISTGFPQFAEISFGGLESKRRRGRNYIARRRHKPCRS